MGAINVTDALKQMDGVFGCKVSFSYNEENKTPEYTFSKKTIFEWASDFFSSGDTRRENNFHVMNGLCAIEKSIENADSGEFKALVDKYKSNNGLIDFKEIRRTLRSTLKMQFPPVISEIDAHDDSSNLKRQNRPASYFKDLYLKNMHKSICTEKYEVEIIHEAPFGEVSDANLEGFALAWRDLPEQGDKQIFFVEKNAFIAKRIDEMLDKMLNAFGNEARSPVVHQEIDGSTIVASNPAYQNGKRNSVIDKAWILNDQPRDDEEDDLDEIDRLSSYNQTEKPIQEKLQLPVCENDTKEEVKMGKDVDYWMEIYDGMLKKNDRDGIETKGSTFEIFEDFHDGISEENLKAICEILIWMSKNDKMPGSINGATGSTQIRIYFALFDMDEEIAKKFRSLLPEVKMLNDNKTHQSQNYSEIPLALPIIRGFEVKVV